MKKMFLFTLLFVVGLTTLSKEVTGVVLDKDGEPLTGVEITADGKTYYTDFEGKFTIDTDSDTLEVGMVSYSDKLVPTNCCDTIVLY